MKRGTILWIDLSDAAPPEMGKVRPAIVVSASIHNQALSSVVVVPLSTIPPEIWPLRVGVGSIGGKPNFAVIPGIRQVSKHRLRNAIGALTPAKLAKLDEALQLYLH